MILFQFIVIYGTKFNEHKLAWTSCTFSYSSEASLTVGNGSGPLFFCQLLAHFFRFLSSYMGIFCKLTLILSDWCWSQGIFAITASCLLIHGARKVGNQHKRILCQTFQWFFSFVRQCLDWWCPGSFWPVSSWSYFWLKSLEVLSSYLSLIGDLLQPFPLFRPSFTFSVLPSNTTAWLSSGLTGKWEQII